MKKLSLIVALTLSTMLSACGGGGGHHGYVPPTTLPDNPAPIGPSNSGDDTPETNTSFTNLLGNIDASGIDKRTENVIEAQKAVASPAKSRMRKAASRNTLSEADVDKAYANMYNSLVNGEANDQDLRMSLTLAGIKDFPQNCSDDELKKWVEINAYRIRIKANEAKEMYGSRKEKISSDNAKLTMVNIENKQDSYISFTVDNKGAITGIKVNGATESADIRSKIMTMNGDGVFKHEGLSLVYTLDLPDDIHLSDVEAFEKLSIEDVRSIMMAKAYEELDGDDLEKALNAIKNAKDSDFHVEGDEEKPITTIVTYEKGDTNLKYSEYGTVHIDSMEGDKPVDDRFVFVGGYDALKMDKDKLAGNDTLTFKGGAVATAIYQRYDNVGQDDGSIEKNRVLNLSKKFNGDATLVFDTNSGAENLTADFTGDSWYKVDVKGQQGQYDITFNNGDKISANPYEYTMRTDAETSKTITINDADYFKFKDKGNNFTITDFNKENNPEYGAVDFGYYGKDINDLEAAGFVAYGNSIGNNEELHVQIGFGAQKQ